MMPDLPKGFLESVSCIRDLGFNNVYGLGAPQEQMFFVDSQGNRSLHLKSALFATPEEIVKEGIDYMRRHADTLQEYLDNGMNNNTHEWAKTDPHVHTCPVAPDPLPVPKKFDPTDAGEDTATAQQMALVNPTVENLMAVGVIDPLSPKNKAKIDAWLKDDPDGGKGRAAQRIRAEVCVIVEKKCHEELGLLYDQVSFENFPAMGITVHATLIPEDLRNLSKYADEYLSLYYKDLAKLMDTWVPVAVSAEQPPPQPTVKFADVVLVCGTPTCTGRVFPKDVVMAAVKKFRHVVGTLPVYIGFKDDRSVAEVAGVTKDLQMDGDQLVAYVETLDTPEGRRLVDLLKAGKARLATDGSGEVDKDGVVREFSLEALVVVEKAPEPAKPLAEKPEEPT